MRSFRALLLVLATSVAAFAASAARAAEPTPRLRAHLEATKELWVGQKASLIVEVLTPGYFSGNPVFDLPQAPGLILMLPEGRPVLSTEEIDGVSYTVQRHELSVYPARPGRREIPAFAVRFGYKPTPLVKDATPAELKTTPVALEAKLPPGAENLGIVISAHHFEATDQWTPEPGKARVGDALKRVITMTAPDVPSMIFPPFRAPPIDGLGIYLEAPEVQDSDERGSMVGRRRESLAYVCERSGRFIVPDVRITWWDLDARELRTIDFPRQILTVVVNPSYARDDARGASLRRLRSPEARHMAMAVLSAVIVAALLWRFRRSLEPVIDYWRPRHLAPLNPPEPAVDAEILHESTISTARDIRYDFGKRS